MYLAQVHTNAMHVLSALPQARKITAEMIRRDIAEVGAQPQVYSKPRPRRASGQIDADGALVAEGARRGSDPSE